MWMIQAQEGYVAERGPDLRSGRLFVYSDTCCSIIDRDESMHQGAHAAAAVFLRGGEFVLHLDRAAPPSGPRRSRWLPVGERTPDRALRALDASPDWLAAASHNPNTPSAAVPTTGQGTE